jgi:hypothetical protein
VAAQPQVISHQKRNCGGAAPKLFLPEAGVWGRSPQVISHKIHYEERFLC